MFEQDKIKHMSVGFLLSFMFVWISPLAAILVVVFAGLAKEYYDSTGKGCVEGWDTAATVFGGLPIPLVVEVVSRIT